MLVIEVSDSVGWWSWPWTRSSGTSEFELVSLVKIVSDSHPWWYLSRTRYISVKGSDSVLWRTGYQTRILVQKICVCISGVEVSHSVFWCSISAFAILVWYIRTLFSGVVHLHADV
jgi:hypothetical protein